MKEKILYVFGGEKAQGAEIVIERLMRHNLKRTETHLFIAPGPFSEKLISGNVDYKITLVNDLKKLNRALANGYTYYLKAIKNYFSISAKVYNYITIHDIKIVHANTIVPTTYLLPLIIYSKFFKRSVRFVWSDHDMRYFSGLEIKLSKLCASLYHRTLVVSEAVKRKYHGKKDVMVLYNGLDTRVFKKDSAERNGFRKYYGIETGDVVIGIAGKITPDKGQLEVLQVFNKISNHFPSVKLVIAGAFDEEDQNYKQEVLQQINSNRNIIYAGFLNSVVAYYNGCDILINNSNNTRSESLGTSIYEAMACNKMVIAAATGGTPEIITDQIDGFLFKVDDKKDLEDKLVAIIAKRELFEIVGIAARNKVERKFEITKMVNDYNKVIASL